MAIEWALSLISVCAVLLAIAGFYLFRCRNAFEDLKDKSDKATAVIIQLSKELDASHIEADKLTSKCAILETEVASLCNQLLQAKENNEKLSSENEEHIARYLALNECTKAYVKLQKDYDAAITKIAEQEITISTISISYQDSLTALEKKEKELAEYKEAYKHAQKTIGKIESEWKEKFSEQKEKYVVICDSLSKDRDRCLKEKQRLEEQFTSGQKELSSFETFKRNYRRHVESLSGQNEELTKENSCLQKENSRLQSKLESLKETIRSLRSVQARLDYFLDLSKPENEKLLRGYAYELQIGKRYERLGYFVLYSGIVLEMMDQGVDIIAISPCGDQVLIIQCKNYTETSTLDHRHIRSFLQAVSTYSHDAFIDSVVPILFYTSSTFFEPHTRELLISEKVGFLEENFNPVYLNGIYEQLEKIRNEQTRFFFDSRNNNILRVNIFHKIKELRNSPH